MNFDRIDTHKRGEPGRAHEVSERPGHCEGVGIYSEGVGIYTF